MLHFRLVFAYSVVVALFLSLRASAVVIPSAGQAKDQLTEQELSYLENDPTITHKITFSITSKVTDQETKQDTFKSIGDLTLGMFGITVPKTVSNFVHLSNMTYGYGYKNAVFHRIINNFMIQGGDFQNAVGTGGHSIYNDKGKFKDENFEIGHNKMGRLSMANSGPDTNGAQFFITNTPDCSFLDGKHVVFGQLIGGFDTLAAISAVPTDKKNSRPIDDIFISQIKIEVLNLSKRPSRPKIQNAASDPNVAYDDIADSTPNYIYLFIVIFIVGVIFVHKQWSYKKQYITDIKDSEFF
ncbi:cyclophilin-like domain-containing protein [Scheffersomyces xylosifermentans]|uniref:cyclophilin-like domain-containing protein n=1 Tax=Scheffersomyces xylosifermentans TaxID=1304137 RepID=UPI00315D4BDA